MQQSQDIREKYASEHIGNGVFYIPFAYYAVVRAGTLPKMLSWLLIYVMPTFAYGEFAANGVTISYCINYLLLLISVFCIYETGYIHNDTFAIRKETQPALRLYDENMEHFFAHWKLIFGLRMLYAAIALGVFLWYNHFSTEAVITVFCVLLIIPVFLIYNAWRNPYNAFFYPILVFSRYLPFLLPYRPEWHIVLLLFLSFPFCNMLERFSMPRHRFSVMRVFIPTEESKTLFRVVYYLVVMAGLLGCYLWREYDTLLLIPISILFFYRLFVFFIVRRKTPRNYLPG